MEFKETTQEDLDFVRANPYEGAVKDYPYMEAPDANTMTIVFEGQIVGVGGLFVHWEGVGTLWLILTADCKKNGLYGILALSAIKDKVDELLRDNNIVRAQAAIRTDFPEAIKMIQFLGFSKECLSEKYFPDRSDAYRYSRIL